MYDLVLLDVNNHTYVLRSDNRARLVKSLGMIFNSRIEKQVFFCGAIFDESGNKYEHYGPQDMIKYDPGKKADMMV